MLISTPNVTQFIENMLRAILDNSAISVSAATKLPDIAGLDSIKTVELILRLEDHYDIRVNADDMDRIGAISDLVDIVGGRRGKSFDEYIELISRPDQGATPITDSSSNVIIETVEMLGQRSRFVGKIEARQDTVSILLIHPDYDGFEVELFRQKQKNFDITCSLDLARFRLDRCRLVEVGGNFRQAARALPTPARILIAGMADGGSNRSHLTAVLPEEKTKADITEILHRFESLGDNCEFGVFSKMLGDDRPGLFRAGGTSEWMTVPRPGQHTLATALQSSFEGFGTGADLRLEYIGDEWLCFSNRYDFCFHTGVKDKTIALQPLLESEYRRLPLLTRKLLNDIGNPAKVFIRKSNGSETQDDIIKLARAMRQPGQAWLLWVCPANAEEPPGTITIMPDRIMRVTISELSDYKRANRVNALAWMTAITAVSLVLESPLC